MSLVKKLRLLVLAAPAVAMLATALPADAAPTGAGAVVFTGTASTTPLSYPCFPVGTTAKCPVVGSNTATVTVYTPTGGTTTIPLPIGGNGGGFGFNSAPNGCVGAAVRAGDAAAGTCNIVANGTVEGSCGLSTGGGTGSVTVTDFVGVPPTSNAITIGFTFAFVGVGGTLVITGRENAAATSQLVGTVEAIPVPNVSVTPSPTITNSCSNKTANQFLIAGSAAIVTVS